jgi:hypothetical protein
MEAAQNGKTSGRRALSSLGHVTQREVGPQCLQGFNIILPIGHPQGSQQSEVNRRHLTTDQPTAGRAELIIQGLAASGQKTLHAHFWVTGIGEGSTRMLSIGS